VLANSFVLPTTVQDNAGRCHPRSLLPAMMAPLLPPDPPARVSQMLSTVKCSNCNKPVPFTELGEHVCDTAPSTPTLPKPSLSALATAALLPQRLQNRIPSPVSNRASTNPSPAFHRSMASNASASSSAFKLQDAQPPPSIDRLRANAGSPASFSQPQRASPLGQSNEETGGARLPGILQPGGRSPTRPGARSPLNPNPGPSPPPPVNPRPRMDSNAASIPSTRPNPPPSLNPPRPPYAERPRQNSLPQIPNANHNPNSSFNPRSFTPQVEPIRQNTLPLPPNQGPHPSFNHRPLPPPRDASRSPYYQTPLAQPSYAPVQELDTKIGGEAGMAGVGRRGFHAAARAAMLVATPAGRRMNVPNYLDTNVPRGELHISVN
jgi:hypothetical protein